MYVCEVVHRVGEVPILQQYNIVWTLSDCLKYVFHKILLNAIIQRKLVKIVSSKFSDVWEFK